MAENLAKKKIHGGRRASATQMVNTVGKMITAFDAASTSELDIRPRTTSGISVSGPGCFQGPSGRAVNQHHSLPMQAS